MLICKPWVLIVYGNADWGGSANLDMVRSLVCLSVESSMRLLIQWLHDGPIAGAVLPELLLCDVVGDDNSYV